MNTTLLILGGNQGNVMETIQHACASIQKSIGNIKKKSELYQTAAWGKTNQPDFLNQVVEVETELTPQQLLNTLLSIEKQLGRIRTASKWEERSIDIDILFYNSDIINDQNLTIPHPHLQDRKFVLMPLSEIAPQLKHPVLKKNTMELLNECKDSLNVKKYPF